MKILMLTPALSPGGTERVMSVLINDFCKREDVELHVLLYGRKRDIFYEVDSKAIIHRPPFPFDNSRRFRCTIKTLLYLRRKTKEINPDTILNLGELWNSFVLLSLLGLSYPIYIGDRCQPDKKFSLFHELLRSWLYPRSSGIIVQTDKAYEIYRKRFGKVPIRVIGNPIRTIYSKDSVCRENIVLSVGRLIPSKHHEELIRMFAALKIDDWKLYIVGGDALKMNLSKKLQRVIDELDASNQIFLLGNQRDVDYYYLRSKIFAFTSTSEGFPNALGEAMSAGLAVIAFDCMAGPSDMIINGENGILVKLCDFNDFSSDLQHLMESVTLRETLGCEAKRSIKKYSEEEICDSFYHFVNLKRYSV